jgi:hypothetical protein
LAPILFLGLRGNLRNFLKYRAVLTPRKATIARNEINSTVIAGLLWSLCLLMEAITCVVNPSQKQSLVVEVGNTSPALPLSHTQPTRFSLVQLTLHLAMADASTVHSCCNLLFDLLVSLAERSEDVLRVDPNRLPKSPDFSIHDPSASALLFQRPLPHQHVKGYEGG